MNSREAAFLALLSSLKEERYISDSLESWFVKEHPLPQDFHLAQQIAYGSAQRALTLDFLISHASNSKKARLKLKERAFLRTAVYQLFFLDRIPSYAVVDESMKLAKKYFHSYFSSYLHALLRKLSITPLKLPEGQDIQSISMRYSYPVNFVSELYQVYGSSNALKILEEGNKPSLPMARVRNGQQPPLQWPVLLEEPFKVVQIPSHELEAISTNKDYYIQNVTPAYLIGTLAKQMKIIPERILDVCAAPGGKSIAVHDLFPTASLYANDISELKVQRLKENLEKYDIQATVSCMEGQNLDFNKKFDLIILDVPCSNSGVLNKRPEARWRLNEIHSNQLKCIQEKLLKNAVHLLNPEGEIWYMTCSILPGENEEMVNCLKESLGLKVKESLRILPNNNGWDGGFACSLINNLSLD